MKVAFIGGNGHHYLRWLYKEPNCPIDKPAIGAGDGYDDKGRQFTEGLGKPEWAGESKFYDDARAMLDTEKPDILSVGAVYGYNGQWVIEGLKRGMKVISDKPIAATWEQFHEIEALCTTHQRQTLITEFDLRTRPAFRAAKLAVDRGDVGTVSLATAQKSYRWGVRPDWYKDRARYAGTLMWVASHGIDLIRYTTNLKVLRVTGHSDNAARPDYRTMEDHTASLFQLENHATGLVHADFLRPDAAKTHGDDRIRVIGGEGVVEVRDGKCLLIKNDAPEQDITATGDTREPYREMFAAMMGERSDIYSTAHSLELAKLLLHSRDAADRREWIEV